MLHVQAVSRMTRLIACTGCCSLLSERARCAVVRNSPWATAWTVLAVAVLVACSSGNTDGGAAPQPGAAPPTSESPADVAEGLADSSESVAATEPLSSQETPVTSNATDWTLDLPGTLTLKSAVAHVHGAVLRDRRLLVATHDGLTSVDLVTGATESVGASRDDLMAFAQNPTGALFASGHAGPGSSFGEPMGLIRSDDAGRAWSEISLGGEADFHSLAADGTAIAGWATTGALLWSEDEGESWLPGPVTTAYSVALFKEQLWLAIPDVGLAMWNRDANAIEPVGQAGVLLATADDGSAMWRVDPDGSVHRTLEGRNWQQAGSVGAAEAIAASRNSAFIITATGVQRLHVGG